MGKLFEAVKAEAARRPNSTSYETRLREHLGKDGWKDFEKACVDRAFSTSAIHRVLKKNGFSIGYSALQRIRTNLINQSDA